MNRHLSRSVLVVVCGTVLLATAYLLNSREPDRVPAVPAKGQVVGGSEADFDRLVELIQGESGELDGWTVVDSNDIDSYEAWSSLIIGGGLTIRELSFFERCWYRLQEYLQNDGQTAATSF